MYVFEVNVSVRLCSEPFSVSLEAIVSLSIPNIRYVLTYLMIYVTGPGKTGLIYTKYTCLYYGMYLLFHMFYSKSVKFIEFLMDFCIYDDILDMIQITDKKVLHFKLSKSGQILRVDKTCFPRPGHIYIYLQESFNNYMNLKRE